jgi:hypothetical protein
VSLVCFISETGEQTFMKYRIWGSAVVVGQANLN